MRQALAPGWTQTSPGVRTTFNPGQVTGDWGYVDDVGHNLYGPTRWNQIAPDAGGYFQSPIDLPSTNTTDLSSVLSVHYEETTVEAVFNNGHTIEAEYHDNHHNYIQAGGEEFELLQFHFHSLSENAVDSSLYDMEAHFVHQHEDGGLSVLGVWLTPGAFNAEFDKVFQHMGSLQDEGDEVHVDPINAAALLPADMTGWFWEGSLTTPPASEMVNWFMFSTPVELSQGQIDAYRAAADDLNEHYDFYPGNRPLQLLNGRQLNEFNHEISLYTDDDSVWQVDFGAAVPEPATIAIWIMLGSICLAFSRRRRTAE